MKINNLKNIIKEEIQKLQEQSIPGEANFDIGCPEGSDAWGYVTADELTYMTIEEYCAGNVSFVDNNGSVTIISREEYCQSVLNAGTGWYQDENNQDVNTTPFQSDGSNSCACVNYCAGEEEETPDEFDCYPDLLMPFINMFNGYEWEGGTFCENSCIEGTTMNANFYPVCENCCGCDPGSCAGGVSGAYEAGCENCEYGVSAEVEFNGDQPGPEGMALPNKDPQITQMQKLAGIKPEEK